MPRLTRIDTQTSTKVTINYNIIGNGEETIVFHHGNGNCLTDWYTLGFVDALKQDFTLILIDSRGYGDSSKLHDPKEYSLKSRADDTIAVLDKENIDQAHCLGASIGAATCFLLARFYPERFKSYIFATPYFTLFDDDVKTEMTKGVKNYVAKLEDLMGEPIKNLTIRNTFLSNDPLALLAANSSEWFNYKDYIQYIESPCLVYVGSKEPSVKELKILVEELEDNSRQTCKIHIFSNADHVSVYWAGEKVAPTIAEFVNEVAANECRLQTRL